MSQHKVLHISGLSALKLAAFVVSILMVIGYGWLPERVVKLYPIENSVLSIFSDEGIGGKSRVIWLDQDQSEFQCTVPSSDSVQYCGGSITWWQNDGVKYYDFSNFDRLLLDVNYQGQAANLVINLYNQPDNAAAKGSTSEQKAMSVNVRTRDFNQPVEVSFSDFKVADWWISQFNVSREFAHVELDKISSIGVASSPPFSHQPDIIAIRGIYAAGVYFSKETLYASLLVFWALLLMSEALFHYWALHRRIARDAAKLQTLSEMSAKYKVKAETDKLTGLSNREGLAQTLKAIEQNQAQGHYALLLIDVDHFKKLNDQHGHNVGDLVLEELAHVINKSIRSTDLLCRWGGEEFVLLFRYTQAQDVYPFAEKIRLEIASASFAGTLNLSITVSIGSAFMALHEKFEQTFKAADQALYTAKRSGRNQSIEAAQHKEQTNPE